MNPAFAQKEKKTKLPTGCLDGQVARWDELTQTWSCGGAPRFTGLEVALLRRGDGPLVQTIPVSGTPLVLASPLTAPTCG